MIYLSVIALLLSVVVAQEDGNLYIDDCYLTEGNAEYIDMDKSTVTINEVNETYNTIYAKFIIIGELPDDAYAEMSIWEGSEYTVPAGFDLSLPICEMLDEPIIGGSFFHAMGFKNEECPPPPGEYGNPSYFPPIQNLLPPSLPRRKYMNTVFNDVWCNDSDLGEIFVYKMMYYDRYSTTSTYNHYEVLFGTGGSCDKYLCQ